MLVKGDDGLRQNVSYVKQDMIDEDSDRPRRGGMDP